MYKNLPLSQAIGGKWFLDRRSLAWSIPFLLATSILSAISQRFSLGYEPEEDLLLYTKLIVSNAVAFLACWALIEVFNLLLLSRKAIEGTSISLVLLLSFVVGAAKGLITGMVSLELDVFSNVEEAIGLKWLQTGILGLLLLPLFALLGHGLEIIRTKSELLVSEKVQALLSQVNLESVANKQVLADFKSKTHALIIELEHNLNRTDDQSVNQVANEVRSLIDSHVRPLSQAIYKERLRAIVPFDLSWASKALFGGSVSSYLVAYALIFLTIFMGFLQVNHPYDALLQSGTFAIAIGLIVSVLLVIRPQTTFSAGLIFLTVTALASFFGISIGDWLTPWSSPRDVVAFGLVIWLLVIQNFVFVVLGFKILKQNKSLNEELGALFAEADIDQRAMLAVEEISKRNLAQYLHSDVQNKLLSTALALESQTDPNPQAALATLRKVLESLDGKPEVIFDRTWESLEASIHEHWSGFLEIQISISPDVPKSLSKPNSLIFEILMEGISNALRHGNADSVSIEISVAPGFKYLELQVTDNGFGPKSGKRGLGSNLLNNASKGKWSLRALPYGGSLLQCSIPISDS